MAVVVARGHFPLNRNFAWYKLFLCTTTKCKGILIRPWWSHIPRYISQLTGEKIHSHLLAATAGLMSPEKHCPALRKFTFVAFSRKNSLGNKNKSNDISLFFHSAGRFWNHRKIDTVTSHHCLLACLSPYIRENWYQIQYVRIFFSHTNMLLIAAEREGEPWGRSKVNPITLRWFYFGGCLGEVGGSDVFTNNYDSSLSLAYNGYFHSGLASLFFSSLKDLPLSQ